MTGATILGRMCASMMRMCYSRRPGSITYVLRHRCGRPPHDVPGLILTMAMS
jgi:hypothetical protein